jgi:ketosteroid isomerase-like protein
MAMASGNVEAFKRTITANNSGNVEALLDELDAAVEWRPVLPVVLGGNTTVYRGHDGVRQMLSDLDAVLAERRLDFSEIREEGDRIVAAGRLRIRGKRSGALTESPFGWVGDFENGKGVCIRTSLNPNDPHER